MNGALLLLAGALTLSAALDEALSRNPAIAAADARQRTAVARLDEARASRLPRLAVSESATRGNNPVFVFGSLLEQGEFAARHFDPTFLNDPDPLTNYRAAATGSFAVFDRFRTATSIRRSTNGVERADVELEETRQRLRAETVARFYGLLIADDKVNVARDAARTAEADAKATRDRFEQGLIVESDALAADVHLAAFRQRVIAAEGDLAIARAALATLLQRPLTDEIAVDGAIPALQLDDTSLAQAIALAITRRAPVKTAANATSDAHLHLVAERGTALPRVDVFGVFGASGGTFGRRDSDYTAGVSITLEVFDRARPARIAAARAEIDTARAGEAIARDAVTMEVVSAWHRLRAAREMAAVATTAARQAEAAARIVRDRYAEGLTTITEQLRAQTVLITTRFDLLTTRYESLVAYAELLRATGDLDDVQPFL